MSYRFAAGDTASEEFRPKAISWVLVGGMFAGIIGPQVVIVTKDLMLPYLFAATYLAQSVLAVVAGGVLMFLDIPVPPRRPAEGEGRPLSEIARQPRFIVAVACGVASYSMMNLVMTSAPLAMVDVRSLGDRRDARACSGTCSACSRRASSPATLIVRFGRRAHHRHRALPC